MLARRHRQSDLSLTQTKMAQLIAVRDRRVDVNCVHINQQVMVSRARFFDTRRGHAHAAQPELNRHWRAYAVTVFQIDEIQFRSGCRRDFFVTGCESP